MSHLTVRYGCRVAVADVSFVARPGAALGLIGPNGAGKTSVLNACSGLLTPTAGSFLLDGYDVSALSPPARARRGIGRTFQRPSLFESLSAFDNVVLGWEAAQAGWNPMRHLRASRRARACGEERALEALSQCGLAHLGGRQAAELTTGQRRLVELARLVAGGFSVLLLDEPSSGLDPCEKDELARELRRLVQVRDLAAVVVEHDMNFVASVCDEVVVVDSGSVVHSGPPATLLRSDAVRRAFLGEARA